MAADASIFGQFLQPVRSVADYAADMDKAEGNKLALIAQRRQNDLAGLQFGQAQAGIADAAAKRNAIQRVYDSLGPNATPIDRARALQANPLTATDGVAAEKGILENDKTRAVAAKDQSETDANGLKLRLAKSDQAMKDIASFQTPDQARTSLMAHIQNGDVDPQKGQLMLQSIPADPNQFGKWQVGMLRGIMTAAEQIRSMDEKERAQLQADTQIKTTGMNNATSRANNQAQVGATIRGQNMTDARQREVTAATVGKPFEVTGPDGTPVLVQQDKSGHITKVEGYGPKSGAAKPLNDSQSKALLFGSRMQEAEKVFDQLGAKGVERPSTIKTSLDGVPLVGSALGSIANATVASADQQSIEQAQRDFINAVLRRESGAAIAPSEFANAEKQYFPAVGDSAQVKAQKKRNRDLATRGLLAEVPEAQRSSISSPSGGAAAGSDPVAAALKKYGG